jgi:hypothetical protein
VVVSASKKDFNVHNITAQQLDRAGNVVHNNIAPLSSIPGLWRFSASQDAVFMFTLIDDTGQAVQVRMQ